MAAARTPSAEPSNALLLLLASLHHALYDVRAWEVEVVALDLYIYLTLFKSLKVNCSKSRTGNSQVLAAVALGAYLVLYVIRMRAHPLRSDKYL